MSKKVCYITAIYGKYERSCKVFAKQTVESDFICFTDDPNITSNAVAQTLTDSNSYLNGDRSDAVIGRNRAIFNQRWLTSTKILTDTIE